MAEDVPYGAWPSPITPEVVVAASVRFGEIAVSGSGEGDPAIWWSEGRPAEGGRTQVVRRSPDGAVADVLPDGFSTRSKVHEYGGGSWWLSGETLFFVGEADQRIWRLDPGFDPLAITPAPPAGVLRRFADGVVSPNGRWVICVEELHSGEGEPHNRLVAVPATGGEPVVLHGNADFVSSPRLDPSGRWLAWVAWDHPSMPWDDTSLWVSEVVDDGAGAPRLAGPIVVLGGDGTSVQQPSWDRDGRLWCISDATDWWTLHAGTTLGPPGAFEVMVDRSADIGMPPWVFGQSRYAALSDGRIVYAASSDGTDHLAVLDPRTREVDNVATDATSINGIVASDITAIFVGASFSDEASVRAVLVGRGGASSGSVLRPPRRLGFSTATLSEGRAVSFPTGGDGKRVAHALVYLPVNPSVTAPPGQRPPAVVTIHGGPTAAARPELRLETQYWTSRGFAVIDVNYRGSTGFGRRYRNELRGQWGVADVEDCVAAVRFLAGSGHVDPARVFIRGGSAGGFTVLEALAQSDAFAAGAVLYGVADLELLAADTHKFESRYLDGLIGPYPQARDVYVERSPIHHVERITAPVIVFQGLDDKVVPPNQSEAIVEALRGRGVPVEYHAFEGEGHGFRRAETMIAVLDAELAFYRKVLDFGP